MPPTVASNERTTVSIVASPRVVALHFDDSEPSSLLGFAICRAQIKDVGRSPKPFYLPNYLKFGLLAREDCVMPADHDRLLGFGKHSSKSMGEVVLEDSEYTEWCMQQKLNPNPKMSLFQAFVAEFRIANTTKNKFTPSNLAPFQDFSWFDYAVVPGTRYLYTVYAVRWVQGQRVQDSSGVSIAVTTHTTEGSDVVCFNKGVAGSKAYERKFGYKPNGEPPSDKARKWLENGLNTTIVEHIDSAVANDELYVASYEFSDPIIAQSLKRASLRGARVYFFYDEKMSKSSDFVKEDPEFSRLVNVTARKSKASAHNKFIVLVREGLAVWVLTGSTNFTPGGIYGQHNVVHVVRDRVLAEQFLSFWRMLVRNPDHKALAVWNETTTPIPAEVKPLQVLFCPRSDNELLSFFAQMLGATKTFLCLSCPFGVPLEFVTVLTSFPPNGPLRYILLEKPPRGSNLDLEKDPRNLIAAGSLGQGESTTGLNDHVEFSHTKMFIIDPMGPNPMLVCGSGNFSQTSCMKNDENYLVLKGQSSNVDVYFCEFMRVWRHWKSRYESNKQRVQDRKNQVKDRKLRVHLDPTPAWTSSWYDVNNVKSAIRVKMLSSE